MAALHIIGVPIGNYQDISFRALGFLKEADLILCEDTRETEKLLLNFAISCRTLSYVGSYNAALKQAKESLDRGLKVALVSDRGMPCISDPGAKIVEALKVLGYKITVIPGCCAATAAYALSGLSGGFIFHGFLPRKSGAILKAAQPLAALDYNLIFFESPKRINYVLEILEPIFAQRKIFIIKEITKTFEEAICLDIKALIKREYKGELVLIIARA